MLQDKINIQVIRSREWISTALLQLMEGKPYHKITISEITMKAGVSRQTFYRNYKDKDDIIIKYLDVLFQKFLEDVSTSVASMEVHVVLTICIKAFEYFEEHSDLLLMLVNQGIDNLLLQEFINFVSVIERSFVNMSLSNNFRNYLANFFAGGVYFVLLEWLKEGMKKSPTEMGEYIYTLVYGAGVGVIEKYFNK